jgi:hypothetical protein
VKTITKYFLYVAVPVGLVLTMIGNWKVGLVFGCLAGFFAAFHLGRSLQAETFEINASNKDRMKGLTWYQEEIAQHMRDLRYQLIVDETNLKEWQPSPRARIMGGNFRMETTPYSITISGPRGVIRILKSILDLNKIFI